MGNVTEQHHAHPNVGAMPRWRVTYEQAEAEKGAGMNGQALHFSGAAVVRKAVSEPNPLQEHPGDFTVSVWVKGEPESGYGRSYEVLSAVTGIGEREYGWKMGVNPSGAWYWKASGEEVYTYEPTFARQPIRDGRWHQLVFTYAAAQPEVRLYYDGVNVAIYSVPMLAPHIGLEAREAAAAGIKLSPPAWLRADTLWIGGEPQGDTERETFPGWIDKLWIDDRALTADEIGRRYGMHRTPALPPQLDGDELTLSIMTFNIWNGGRETGAEIGVKRIIDVIRDSGADIVAMQETYGSGPIIADALGYYFYLRSSNLSIMSRFPIEETYPFYQPFHCGGARLKLNDGLRVNVFSIWLHYLADYWGELYRESGRSLEQLLEGERGRMKELAEIMRALEPLAARSEQEPLLLCGDFNSGSHVDWIEATRQMHNGYTFPFPQSIALERAGYRDTYREVHPDPSADPSVTWPAWEQEGCIGDRIDFIYAHGSKLRPEKASKINAHSVRYPSDHAAVVVEIHMNR
ncbi:LamG-like jellyroll fold domain-containing protein [Paenibacillus sp. LHD-38]|uniref:LamG-like jellyroll fold domain-containing protein n=1 Tax=Paenibacillus sp. LHD-38 TaxID=3072143 RepID=UPI00280E3DF4|nr:LamG-like jellyroll fold domain-containing protein [Paenibacillus sp. LHD-38]MDQ8734497.1 LamG-like jellyroll fold domain-containing protein [Paenibacillus sp. LHD-38]